MYIVYQKANQTSAIFCKGLFRLNYPLSHLSLQKSLLKKKSNQAKLMLVCKKKTIKTIIAMKKKNRSNNDIDKS